MILLCAWLHSWFARLSALASSLKEGSAVDCTSWSHSLGECTAYDGYTIGLACELAGSTPEKPLILRLECRIRAMTSAPVMEMMELAWSDWEARPFRSPVRNPVLVDGPLLAKLDASFPRLESVLRKALKLGPQRRANVLSVCVEMDRESEPVGPFPLADALELGVVQSGFRELFGSMLGKPIVLSPLLYFPAVSELQGPPAAFPGCQVDTWRDFQCRNQSWVALPEDFELHGRATLLYSEPPDVGFEPLDFFSRFPRSPGIFHFSRPGFDAAAEQALVVVYRNDGLASEARPENHPTESAYFHQLCFLQREKGEWRLVGLTDWTVLMDRERMVERGEEMRRRRLEEQLLAAGWTVVEFEKERLRLRDESGSFLTVVTDGYVSRQLNVEPEEPGFFVCADRLLIVPWIEERVLLEKLSD